MRSNFDTASIRTKTLWLGSRKLGSNPSFRDARYLFQRACVARIAGRNDRHLSTLSSIEANCHLGRAVTEGTIMNLARASAYANTAARMRALNRTRGVTSLGYPLWTTEENETCRRLYPDYAKLRSALPGRSYYALRSRCKKLKITKPCRPWTGSETAKRRMLYATSSWDSLKAAFPRRAPKSIMERACAWGLPQEAGISAYR